MAKYLRNPALGLIPILVFSILIGKAEVRYAACVGLIISCMGFFLTKKESRLIYDVSAVAFLVAMPISFLFPVHTDGFLFFCTIEVIFVALLIFVRLSRSRIVQRLVKTSTPLTKNYLSESFRVAFQTQYGLLIHLLFVLLFFMFHSEGIYFIHAGSMKVIMQGVLIAIILMETARLWILNKKLYKEEWLPVVDEDGHVTGRVAKSITKNLKNRFMHPVVRVALIHGSKLYLEKRDDRSVLNPGMLDYPYEKYMQFNHNLDEAVSNIVNQGTDSAKTPVRFLLKYIFENENTKRLIFLYVLVIDEESAFNTLNLNGGKLWTISQIEDNLGMSVFSECFEMEYEYLKNTVLLVQKLKEHGS